MSENRVVIRGPKKDVDSIREVIREQTQVSHDVCEYEVDEDSDPEIIIDIDNVEEAHLIRDELGVTSRMREIREVKQNW